MGTSKYKLIKTIQDLWKIIGENKLLPHYQAVPRRTLQRIRNPNASIIGIYFEPLPAAAAAKASEVRKQAKYEASQRMMAFRAAKATLNNHQDEEAFNAAMVKTRAYWASEETNLAAEAVNNGDPAPKPG